MFQSPVLGFPELCSKLTCLIGSVFWARNMCPSSDSDLSLICFENLISFCFFVSVVGPCSSSSSSDC